jgi:hypothetical protein
MKLFFSLIVLALFSYSSICAQGEAPMRNPVVVVVPSETWCNKNGYVKRVGDKVDIEYERVFRESELIKAITNDMNGRFTDNGITMTLIDQAMKSNSDAMITQSVQTDKYGQAVSKSMMEELVTRFRPDWIVELDLPYASTADGSKAGFEYVSLSYRIFDAFTSTVISSRTEKTNSLPKGYSDLQSSIISLAEIHVPNIISDIKTRVDDFATHGRQVQVTFKTSDVTMDDEFGEDDEELTDLVKRLIQQNAVRGAYNVGQSTENFVSFTPRMPISFVDAESWLKSFIKPELKKIGLKAKYDSVGAGIVDVIISKAQATNE